MKVFTNLDKAEQSFKSKPTYYLNSECPFRNDGRLCGSWCSLFFLQLEGGKISFTILGCKGTDKRLYVN